MEDVEKMLQQQRHGAGTPRREEASGTRISGLSLGPTAFYFRQRWDIEVGLSAQRRYHEQNSLWRTNLVLKKLATYLNIVYVSYVLRVQHPAANSTQHKQAAVL